jgi:hypothetical protein
MPLPTDRCPLCGERNDPDYDEDTQPIYIESGPVQAHRICLLRDVLGGIGHLVAHEYWCTQRHDPDAGLTYYQSARLVQAWVNTVGVEAAASR